MESHIYFTNIRYDANRKGKSTYHPIRCLRNQPSGEGIFMQKIYVLDTNVLIQSPYALQSFEDNHVVLPLAVLEELDGLKNADGETGANARQAIRFLESLRKADVYKRQVRSRPG